MTKISEYALIYHWSADELTEAISDLIHGEGWQPFGAPFSTQEKGDTLFYQAIVKYREKP